MKDSPTIHQQDLQSKIGESFEISFLFAET
jgi:hypothetical protein